MRDPAGDGMERHDGSLPMNSRPPRTQSRSRAAESSDYFVTMPTCFTVPDAPLWPSECCCARIGEAMPSYARRRGARCGSEALDFRDIRVGGEPVQLPLCRVHFRKLRDSADPAALTLAWAR
jgi:hypothetical protein